MKTLVTLIILSVVLLPEPSANANGQLLSADTQRQSLGVNVEETSQGLVVRSFLVGSTAVGHLEVGDVLQFLAANGHPVYSTQTLQQMKMAKDAIGLDVPAYLQIQRGGAKRVFDVEFAASGTIIGNGRVMSIDDALQSTAAAEKKRSNISSPETASGPLEAPGLSFERMVTAELREDKDGTEIVIFRKPRWAEETMEYTFNVTVMKQEERVRTKTIPNEVVVDGKSTTVFEDVAETYTVNVPVTEQHTETRAIRKPVGESEQVEVPIDAVKAWSVGGKLLSSVELKSRIRGLQRVFVLPSGASEYFADPFFTTAVSNDVLVIAAPAELGPLPAFLNSVPPAASDASSQIPQAVAAPVSEALPPVAAPAPPASEATPSVTPPVEPEPPSTETPIQGSSQEN